MGTIDKDGYIYLIGRKKDMIVSSGKNVYPTEVENAIYAHPSVSEVAVIGIPDKEFGEAIKAVVVLKEGQKTTEEEIIELCRKTLLDYAVPKSIDFVDMLPKTSSGKIIRTQLREKYKLR
jgi:acyl-CoA synthetase (AMP-forming)/AMP-acid ligase II